MKEKFGTKIKDAAKAKNSYNSRNRDWKLHGPLLQPSTEKEPRQQQQQNQTQP
jgi:hypothetical protein